ncbi:MAG: tRNA (adenosine(37)-N6)-threonylcarbamoyltransferase complex dimerization subunit type 1 TsaB [Chlamydiales bacterium]
MLVLILETSSEKGFIILADKDTPVRARALPGGPELSRVLAKEVYSLLDGLQPELIAVGTGPGSYTGVRVGVALAQGLSYGWGVPLLGFCSLRIFGPPPVLVDARSGKFYAWIETGPSLISSDDPLLQQLPQIRSPHPALIRKHLLSPPVLSESNPDPSFIAPLIWEQFLQEGTPPLQFHYLSHP